MKHSIQSNPDFGDMRYYFLAEMILNDIHGNPNRKGIMRSGLRARGRV
jgi:hypothetical protein